MESLIWSRGLFEKNRAGLAFTHGSSILAKNACRKGRLGAAGPLQALQALWPGEGDSPWYSPAGLAGLAPSSELGR